MKLILAIALVLATSTAIAESPFVKGELLIKFKNNSNNTNYHSKKYFKGTKIHLIQVPPKAEEHVRKALAKNPNVEFVELNSMHKVDYMPNDTRVGTQWWLNTINAFEAMDVSQGEGVTVGICDTGVNPNHEDLQNVLLPGWNFFANNSDATNYVHQHGTIVAGTIAANTNNNKGVAALANKVKIIPGRIADDTNGWTDTAREVECQEYMADNGAKVINISYAGACDYSNAAAARYADSKDTVVVWAAGNENTQLTCGNIEEQTVVSATTNLNTRASFSNYGSAVDIAAPGENVSGLWLVPNQYGNLSGTSFSSPIVASVAAIIYSKNPGITAKEVRNILYTSATDLGNTNYYGHGLVDAFNAINNAVCGNGIIEQDELCDDGNLINGDGCDSICNIELSAPPNPPDLTPPTVSIDNPKDGSSISRLKLRGIVSDETLLDYAEIYINGGLAKYMDLEGQTSSTLRYNWKGPKGSHILKVIAMDAAGNESIEIVSFTISNRK